MTPGKAKSVLKLLHLFSLAIVAGIALSTEKLVVAVRTIVEITPRPSDPRSAIQAKRSSPHPLSIRNRLGHSFARLRA